MAARTPKYRSFPASSAAVPSVAVTFPAGESCSTFWAGRVSQPEAAEILQILGRSRPSLSENFCCFVAEISQNLRKR
jgi:hypothetical protein